MSLQKSILLLAFFLTTSAVLMAQERRQRQETEEEEDDRPKGPRRGSGILDDSTQLVYGPTTSAYTFQRNIKFNQPKFQTIDTSMLNLERFTTRDRLGQTYQDLGNNGTAMWPTFFQTPDRIGARPGFDAYNIYVKTPDDIKYYDTKSPFINLFAGLGGQGRSLVDFSFSRNVNPNWNLGFDITKLTSDKQIGAIRNEGDRNVVGTTFDFYSYYKSPNGKYTMLANVISFTHTVDETGGVLVAEDDTTRAGIFEYQDAVINLRTAENTDKRLQLHQYHQYQYSDFLAFYLETDYITRSHGFTETDLGGNDFYGEVLIDESETSDAADFKSLENEAGIKGNIDKFFYNLYIRRRDLAFTYKYYKPFTTIGENYGGARLRFDLNERNNLDSHFEFLQGGNYKLTGTLTNPLFNVKYESKLFQPGLMQQDFFGNHYEWHNNFSNIFTNELEGKINVPLSFGVLSPKVTFKTIDNYTYFDQQIRPAQADGGILVSTYGLDLNLSLKNMFFLQGDARFTTVTGESADFLRIPDFFFNGKLYYEGKWFNDYMPVQVGVNFYYRSEYFANSYDPIIQQFYLQDDFLLESYMAADLFLNMRVDKVFIFAKMTHINMPNGDGYIVTPFYPGQERVFDLGVRWLFFD